MCVFGMACGKACGVDAAACDHVPSVARWGLTFIFRHCQADKLLEKSARRHVQLGQLFSCIMSERLV